MFGPFYKIAAIDCGYQSGPADAIAVDWGDAVGATAVNCWLPNDGRPAGFDWEVDADEANDVAGDGDDDCAAAADDDGGADVDLKLFQQHYMDHRF